MKRTLLTLTALAALTAPASATEWWMLDFSGNCVAAASLGPMYASPAKAYEAVKLLTLGLAGDPTIKEVKDLVGNDAVVITLAEVAALPVVYYKAEAPCRAADKAVKDQAIADAEAEDRKLDKYR